MISIILPYSKNLEKKLEKIDKKDYEIFVLGKPAKKPIKKPIKEPIKKPLKKPEKSENIRFIRENNFATSITKCFEICKGEYVALLNEDVDDIESYLLKMKKILDNGADIVIGRRKNKSLIAKIFVNLLFPKSRKIEDPLSEFFMFKKRIIEGKKISPIGSKILLEILYKGKYYKIEEFPINLKNKNRIQVKERYSKYLLEIAWKEGEIFRFLKFGIVGGTGMLLNEFLLWLFLKLNFLLVISSIFSIESSILWTFMLNELWTFKDKKGISIRRLLKFNFACLIGLLINVSVLLMLNKFFGIHPLKANIVGIASAFIWNFFVHNLWTWYK